MVKLSWAGHGTGRNAAVVCGDKIHEAERQTLDLRQGGNLIHFVQRTVRLDQQVDGCERDVVPLMCGADDGHSVFSLRQPSEFGHHPVGGGALPRL